VDEAFALPNGFMPCSPQNRLRERCCTMFTARCCRHGGRAVTFCVAILTRTRRPGDANVLMVPRRSGAVDLVEGQLVCKQVGRQELVSC
jgi:hypothetical protein